MSIGDLDQSIIAHITQFLLPMDHINMRKTCRMFRTWIAPPSAEVFLANTIARDDSGSAKYFIASAEKNPKLARYFSGDNPRRRMLTGIHEILLQNPIYFALHSIVRPPNHADCVSAVQIIHTALTTCALHGLYDTVRAISRNRIWVGPNWSLLFQAAQIGDLKMCQIAKELSADNFILMAINAIEGGHYGLLQQALKWGANVNAIIERIYPHVLAGPNCWPIAQQFARDPHYVDLVLEYAAREDNVQLCVWLRDQGARDFNRMLAGAIASVSIESSLLAISWGATCANDAIMEAIENEWSAQDYQSVERLLLALRSFISLPPDHIIVAIQRFGNLDIAQSTIPTWDDCDCDFLLAHGAITWDTNLMEVALKYGARSDMMLEYMFAPSDRDDHIQAEEALQDSCALALKCGISANDIMYMAIISGRKDIWEFAVEKGACDFDMALRTATLCKRPQLALFAREHGARDFVGMYVIAIHCGYETAARNANKWGELEENIPVVIVPNIMAVRQHLKRPDGTYDYLLMLTVARAMKKTLMKYEAKDGLSRRLGYLHW